MRESPCLKLIPSLIAKKAKINYYEPTGPKKELEKFKNVNFSKNITEATKKSDLIIIHTEWNEFKQLNLKKIVKNKNVIVYDMRNIYSPEKIKKNGIKYYGIGK
jgi:Predicted UDP-glucose 6-dehydrogenase